MNIPSKRELQKIGFNHSSDIDFQDNIFLVIDTTLPSDNSLPFRRNLVERI